MQNNDWWRGAVIYQVYPRSYFDSTGNGVGDLAGITEKLDYIAGLGVDAVWISPFFTSPMKDFGYDISDYRDIDPIFGTLADFDELVLKAHALTSSTAGSGASRVMPRRTRVMSTMSSSKRRRPKSTRRKKEPWAKREDPFV